MNKKIPRLNKGDLTGQDKFVIGLIRFSFVLFVLVGGVLGFRESTRAQVISGVSQSSISNGDSVVISGSEFGIKSIATPLVWDNFEWGNDGDGITTSGGGYDYTFGGNREPNIVTNQRYGQGTRSVYNEMYESGDEATEFRPYYHELSIPAAKAYLSLWVRWDVSNPGTPQNSIVMWKGPQLSNDNPYVYAGGPGIKWTAFNNFGATSYCYYYDNAGGISCTEGTPAVMTNSNRGKWVRIEMYIEASTPGVADGTLRWWHNGVESSVSNIGNAMTRDTGVTEIVTHYHSGHMMVNDFTEYNTWYAWEDDLYIDNTLQHVEICTGSTWTSRSHCEIQIPQAWSDNSITMTANQGSFSDGDTAYLFVVDENGNVSNGYPITLRSGGDTTPPSLSNPQPTGTLSSGTTSTAISLTTDETAICKYSANSGTNYDLMENTFTNTNSTSHSQTINNLSDGETKTYYIRCQDESNNQNTDDFEISFSIASPSATYSISNFINLVTDWLQSGESLESDVNGDGIVNTRDLGIMMSNWQN